MKPFPTTPTALHRSFNGIFHGLVTAPALVVPFGTSGMVEVDRTLVLVPLVHEDLMTPLSLFHVSH